MAARRSPLFWWVAGAVLLALAAMGVFLSSWTEETRPPGTPGAEADDAGAFPSSPGRRTASGTPGMDPGLKDTLKTIEEINRINEENRRLREAGRRPAPPPSAGETPEPVKPEDASNP